MQDGGAGGAPLQQQAGALGGGDGLRRLRRGVERVIGMGLVRQRTQLFPYLKFKETGREGYTVWDTSFSSDGQVLASASGLAVKLFSTSDGALIHRLLGHKANVLSVAMSGESRRVSAGAADSHIIVWDTEKGGAPLFHWFGSGPVHSMAFSQDAELASGSAGDFTLWDEAVQRSSSRPVASKVTCCGWSNGGGESDVSSRLALGMEDGMLSIRAGGGREQAKHRLPSRVCSVAWNSKEKTPQKQPFGAREKSVGSNNASSNSNSNSNSNSSDWSVMVADVHGRVVFLNAGGATCAEVRSLDLGVAISALCYIESTGHFVLACNTKVYLRINEQSVEMCQLKSPVVSLKSSRCSADACMVSVGTQHGEVQVFELIRSVQQKVANHQSPHGSFEHG